MKYKVIAEDLFYYGVHDLPNWDRTEFIIVCMYDYNICKKTAEKVYDEYHKLIAVHKLTGVV